MITESQMVWFGRDLKADSVPGAGSLPLELRAGCSEVQCQGQDPFQSSVQPQLGLQGWQGSGSGPGFPALALSSVLLSVRVQDKHRVCPDGMVLSGIQMDTARPGGALCAVSAFVWL